ncbi:DNA-binding LytR/AlgR family response regulator [Bacillus sp. SLBN-46]|uniref:hypothetical protein n=1 Tax=Bacillus sp. SLBN-46 TaxID=3042283 RepID=UPI0028659C22|nr:hypothetical protein [Bacillus sp. SLBN-46]MDR6125223.1 DNA-binding LytR/AlgR family response regulator [Bacillus sp. SLBN-46]
MKISIEEINKELAEEILIRCHEVDDEVNEIVNKLKTEDLILLGYHNDKVHRIKLSEIYYFEAVDGRFLATARTTFLRSNKSFMN